MFVWRLWSPRQAIDSLSLCANWEWQWCLKIVYIRRLLREKCLKFTITIIWPDKNKVQQDVDLLGELKSRAFPKNQTDEKILAFCSTSDWIFQNSVQQSNLLTRIVDSEHFFPLPFPF